MHYSASIPFFVSAATMVVTSLSQSIMIAKIQAELERHTEERAENMPPHIDGAIGRYLPVSLTPAALVRKFSRVSDGAQTLTIAVLLIVALIGLGKASTSFDISIGVVLGLGAFGWFTMCICLNDRAYMRIFRPQNIWLPHRRTPYWRIAVHVPNGIAWPLVVAFLGYVVLGVLAL